MYYLTNETRLIQSIVLITVLLFCFSLAFSQSMLQKPTFGNVYPISEPDALEEIKQRAASIDHDAIVRSKPMQDWTALQGSHLPRATKDQQRYFTPLYTTQFAVTDEKGTLLYPEGFTFNPLEHITLPQRMIVIDETDAHWLLDHIQPMDMVIVTQGDYQKITQLIDRPAFLLEKKMIHRFGLAAVPTIVEQKKHQFLLTEYVVDIGETDDDSTQKP